MRIAHIIMAHKNPNQLLRLVKRLEHPNSDIFIHIDKKVAIDDFKVITSLPDIHIVKNRINCNWGGNSFLNAIVGSLSEVISAEHDYDFVNLLSAQDYPLTSADNIYEFFKGNVGKNFVSYEESKESEWWKNAVQRYEKHHFTDFNFKGKYVVQAVVNKIYPKRKFPMAMELFGSCKSSWWTVSGACAKHVYDVFSNNKKLNQFLKYSWGSDEFAIATVVMNSPYKNSTVNNNLRYIDWSEGNAHPKILRSGDFESIQNSNMLFGRKFDDEIDGKIMDRLDEQLVKI